ncbi:MAG: T9SS type A sorting domain-containing protein [Bacteroidetes bacterium]|nr:T9SS type A sorting domain-containing protein [Bacteroidota bacterium]MBU1720996.1 T9SS type A sorting domain-containing protein [Bacteroidota bacterium]
MKRAFLSISVFMYFSLGLCAQTINIGTATQYTYAIFNMNDPYTRHASIYQSSEIGTTGTISQIGWNIKEIWHDCSGPVKIYLKETSDGAMAMDTWANIKNGATVVYNSTVTFPSSANNEWFTIDLATPFTYSTNNLLVLVESNYGGSGNGYIGGDVDFNATAGMSNKSEFWWGNPIQTTGTLSANRPMFQITFGGSTQVRIIEPPEFSVFPNPATDAVFVANAAGQRYCLLNLLGETLQAGSIENDKFLIRLSFHPGLYFLQVVSPKGEVVTRSITVL